MTTLNGNTIYVRQDTDWVNQPRFAQLHILDSTSTTLHSLSTPSDMRTITAFLHDPSGGTAPATYDALVTVCRARTAVDLVDDQGDTTSVYVMSIEGSRIQNVAGATAAKKYTIQFTMELMKA